MERDRQGEKGKGREMRGKERDEGRKRQAEE